MGHMPCVAVPAHLCTNVLERHIFLPHLCLAGIGCIFSADSVGRRASHLRRPWMFVRLGNTRNEERRDSTIIIGQVEAKSRPATGWNRCSNGAYAWRGGSVLTVHQTPPGMSYIRPYLRSAVIGRTSSRFSRTLGLATFGGLGVLVSLGIWATRSSRTARQASVVSPPMFSRRAAPLPGVRTPMTTRSEIEVALRSSRTGPPCRRG